MSKRGLSTLKARRKRRQRHDAIDGAIFVFIAVVYGGAYVGMTWLLLTWPE